MNCSAQSEDSRAMSYSPTAFVIHQEDFLQKRPPFGALLSVMAGRNLAELS
jgi:hypothetical protein